MLETPPMLLIPVMYLRNGNVIKPSGEEGVPAKSDPIALASDWSRTGIEMIHIVDLDTPPSGPSPNVNIIKKIHDELHMIVEVEGNIRSVDTAEKYISVGAARLVLGAIAYQKPAFLSELCRKFPQKIATHIDVRRGKVTIKGWTTAANKTAVDYASQFKTAGVTTIFFSDSEEEGAIKSGDLDRTREFLRHVNMPIFFTQEITTLNDFEKLVSLETYGLVGVLINKSLYDGKIDLEIAVTFLKEKSQDKMDEPTYTENS